MIAYKAAKMQSVQGNQLKDLYTAEGNLSLVQELKHTHDTAKLALDVSMD